MSKGDGLGREEDEIRGVSKIRNEVHYDGKELGKKSKVETKRNNSEKIGDNSFGAMSKQRKIEI